MVRIEVNFSCSKYCDWHWFFKKVLENIAQSQKKVKGQSMGERGFIYVCPDLCFHFLFIELVVLYTHLKEVCRLACYQHFIEWEMKLGRLGWSCRVILSECLLLQIKEVLKKKRICLVSPNRVFLGWDVFRYNLNGALTLFHCSSLCSVCPQCWLHLQGSFLHGNEVVVPV